MEDNRKYRLNKESSQKSVNKDTNDKLYLTSNSNLLPVNDINKILNSAEQFNKERQSSSYYR